MYQDIKLYIADVTGADSSQFYNEKVKEIQLYSLPEGNWSIWTLPNLLKWNWLLKSGCVWPDFHTLLCSVHIQANLKNWRWYLSGHYGHDRAAWKQINHAELKRGSGISIDKVMKIWCKWKLNDMLFKGEEWRKNISKRK